MPSPLIAHCEIPSVDPEKSAIFYKKVFDWDFKPFGKGYLLFNDHKGIMIGLRKVDSVAKGDSTVFHINVTGIDEAAKKIESNGGKLQREKTTIPAMGWYALITDPDGNTIGLYQKA